jgi:hypothetical protein
MRRLAAERWFDEGVVGWTREWWARRGSGGSTREWWAGRGSGGLGEESGTERGARLSTTCRSLVEERVGRLRPVPSAACAVVAGARCRMAQYPRFHGGDRRTVAAAGSGIGHVHCSGRYTHSTREHDMPDNMKNPSKADPRVQSDKPEKPEQDGGLDSLVGNQDRDGQDPKLPDKGDKFEDIDLDDLEDDGDFEDDDEDAASQ